MQKTYTAEQVAKILQVKKGFIYDLIYTGRLRAIRLSKRRIRITEDALENFLKQEEGFHAENISAYSGTQQRS